MISHYIPIFTTIFCVFFFVQLYRHWRAKPSALHIFWWMLGVFFYGAGTVTESINTLFGFSVSNFKAWYILGALLGGAPLAQGTVYLFMEKNRAHKLTAVLVFTILSAAVLVILSPVDASLIRDNRMTGKILEWKFIRYITPFINLYAFAFLVGGAALSAVKYYRDRRMKHYIGNILIAIGGLLPGIGGSFTKFGYIEVLYVTELLGILLIYAGYHMMRKSRTEMPAYAFTQS